MKHLNLNHNFLRAALLVLLATLGIGNAWAGGSSYYTGFKASGGSTGEGYVYASTTNTGTPAYDLEVVAETQSGDLGENGTKKYYAWAKAVRGSEFKEWSISGNKGNVTPNSSTNSSIEVTVTSAKDATNTGTATASWTSYDLVNVTYNPSVYGKYSVTYQYNSYDATTKEITSGDAEGLSRTITSEGGVQTIGSYHNDIITLESTDGVFLGWYSDAGFNTLLSVDNPYTYVAPTSGMAAVYPKYEQVDMYYGRLTACVAAVPYSMPAGGKIFISKEESGTGTYSDEAQTLDNMGMGTTDVKYYLHAQPTDKRYVFRGWYDNPECTGTAISTSADYAYNFTATSTNSATPTTGTIYAAFDFNLYYMQVEVEPAVPGLGMVLVKDNNTGTPDYTEYATNAEQFLYAYRLAPTTNAYLYAKPKYGYKFSGWYDNPDCTGTAVGTANPLTYVVTGTSTDPMNPTIIKLFAKFVEDDAKVNVTYNIPDKTKGEYTASVLDIAEENDEFIWTFTEVYNSADYTANITLSQNISDVLQLEAQPQAGYGVTSWTEGSTTKTTPSQIYNTSGTTVKTFSVTFGEARPFLVSGNSTYYSDFQEAIAAANGSGTITVVQNAYVPAGNYTLNGVALYVPRAENSTAKGTSVERSQNGVTTPNPYVTLTLAKGAHITTNTSIEVGAQIVGKGQDNSKAATGCNGAISGTYGLIVMNEGSAITLNSGAKLYAWGQVVGSGRVTANSGATVYEIFQVTDWCGGSRAYACNAGKGTYKMFPFSQYHVQNIEAPLRIKNGASEKLMAVIDGNNADDIPLIGPNNSSSMFRTNSLDAYVEKSYDKVNDRQVYRVNGTASITDFSLHVVIDVSTSSFILPLTNNMTIYVESGKTTLGTNVIVNADTKIIINEGATTELASGKSLYVYDSEDWLSGFVFSGKKIAPILYSLPYATTTGTSSGTPIRTDAKIQDASILVNGTLDIKGSLYTSSGNANIYSTATGVIKFSSAVASSNTIIYHLKTISGSNILAEVATTYNTTMFPAKLHNGDDSYTLTAGAAANDQFIYSKVQGRWLKNPKTISWNANGGESEASTLAYSEGDFLGELPAAYCEGYTLTGWFTEASGGTQITPTTKVNANATYYAHWTPKTYTISYRDQGGAAFTGTHIDTPTPHPTTHTFGIATPLNGVENKTGYTCGGWYRTPSCSGTVVTTIAAGECRNITLYAKWAPNIHNLTWDANGGTLSGDYTSGEVAYATPIVVPSVDRENYVFTGWSATPASTMPDNDLTYTAQWEPAVASVTVSGNTTYYATIDEAFAYVNTVSADMTIKLLADASAAASLVYQPKSTYTCTLDLNNHTISGTFTKLINVNLANAVLTITDNSTEKGGKITTAQSLNDAVYGLFITAGKANLNAGTIECVNTLQYNSTSAKKVSAYGVYVYKSSARYFTMNGGTVKANATYNAFGVYSAGTTNLNGGKIEVSDVVTDLTRNGLGYGVYVAGATTTISDDANISVNTKQNAYGIYVKASGAIVNVTGGEILAKTASSKNAYGVHVHTGTFNAPEGSTTHITADVYTTTAYSVGAGASGTVNIYDGTYEAKATKKSAGTTTYGVYSSGTTNIHGGTFNVTATKSTARAIGVWRNTTTVDGAPEFNVSAPTIVYGATAAGSTPTKAGAMYSGTLIVNGGTFNVTATSGETAYGVYAYAGTGLSMFSTTNDSVPGNYISAGEVNVSDGIFNVKAKTKAYGIVVGNGTQNKNTAYDPLTAYGQSSITGGKFKVETTGDANATAYAMNTKATATNLLVEGGKYSTKRTNASETSHIEDKYTAPTKDCNYHVLPLTGEDPYKYEVAEAYTITFLDGDGNTLQSTVVKQGTTPSYTGDTPTKTEDENYKYTFNGTWSPTIIVATADATYTAQFSQVEKVIGTKLDIVEWTSNGNGKDSLTLNLNGIPAAGWPYTINNVEYYKDEATATAAGSSNYRAADRTLTIPYSGSADTKLTITVKDKDNNTYSRYKYIIPHVYGETAELAETNSPARIIVVNSGTLTVKGNVTVNAIFVAPGAELKVDESVTLTVDSLMLRTTPWEAAILDNQGTISSSKTYYTRKIADNTKYYQFAIPLSSDVKNVRLSDGSKCTYNKSWMLKSYNEESRANNGAVNTETISNWDMLTTDGEGHATILSSVGYEMFSNTPYYREYYFPVTLPTSETTEVGVSYHLGDAGKNHAGWNALCSPLMRKFTQSADDPSERMKISELNPDGSYQQTAPKIIYPAVPFYYQASDNGKIYFNNDAMLFYAPRRAWNTYIPTQWLQLAIHNLKGDKLDETSIYAHPEKFAPEYEAGYDVAKQSLTGGKALLYSELPCGKLAFAAVPDSLAETRIPLTAYAATEGEYIFSMIENDYLGRMQYVLLHDSQTGLVTNLLESDFAANLTQGTTAGRFYIQCVFAADAPDVSTGVNHIKSENDKAQKIIYNDKVYIIYQGRVYDMTGRQCELR